MINKIKKWECSKCGACCRLAGCKFLKNGLCSIYETRPEICRVKNYSKINELNEACNNIRRIECLTF